MPAKKKIVTKKIENIDRETRKFYICNLATLSELSRTYRREKKITRKQFAEQCGLSPSIVARVENGNQNISFYTVCRVLWAMNKSIEFSETSEKYREVITNGN